MRQIRRSLGVVAALLAFLQGAVIVSAAANACACCPTASACDADGCDCGTPGHADGTCPTAHHAMACDHDDGPAHFCCCTTSAQLMLLPATVPPLQITTIVAPRTAARLVPIPDDAAASLPPVSHDPPPRSAARRLL
jgi:hypothetical protein